MRCAAKAYALRKFRHLRCALSLCRAVDTWRGMADVHRPRYDITIGQLALERAALTIATIAPRRNWVTASTHFDCMKIHDATGEPNRLIDNADIAPDMPMLA